MRTVSVVLVRGTRPRPPYDRHGASRINLGGFVVLVQPDADQVGTVGSDVPYAVEHLAGQHQQRKH